MIRILGFHSFYLAGFVDILFAVYFIMHLAYNFGMCDLCIMFLSLVRSAKAAVNFHIETPKNWECNVHDTFASPIDLFS